MGKVKIFALAVVAASAINAAAATVALGDVFRAGSYPITTTGSKDGEYQDQLDTTAGVMKCTTPSYKGTISGDTTSTLLTPTYQGCTYAGFPATVDNVGCHYVFNVGAGTTGDMDILCVGGTQITVTAMSGGTIKCTLHVGTQSDIGGTATYKTIGSGTTSEVTIEANLTGIDYAHTAGTGLGSCSTGTSTTGTFNLKAVVTGETDGGSTHVALFMA